MRPELKEIKDYVAEEIGKYDGLWNLLSRISVLPEHVRETLQSLDFMANSIAASVLELLEAGRQTEAQILMRSLLEAHAKYLFIISRRDIVVACYEYNFMLPWWRARTELKQISKSLIPSSQRLSGPPGTEDHFEKVRRQTEVALKRRAAELSQKLKAKPRDMKTGQVISDEKVAKIVSRWEWRNIILEISKLEKNSFLYYVDSYSFYSKISHFDAEALIVLPPHIGPKARITTSDEDIVSIILQCLECAADRHIFTAVCAGSGFVDTNGPQFDIKLIRAFRRIHKLKLAEVDGLYLGWLSVAEVDGERITFSVPDDWDER